MAQCDAQTFAEISEERFRRIVQSAADSTGIVLDGNTGEAEANGIRVRWEFDSATQSLVIQCLEHPFFLPCGVIDSQIAGLVKKAVDNDIPSY